MTQEAGVEQDVKKAYREAFAERLEKVIKDLNLTPYGFQKKIGAESRAIYNIVDGRNLPGTFLLSLIKKQYQKLNMDWLLTGKGEMWLSGDFNGTLNEEEGNYRTKYKQLQEENSKLKNQLIQIQEKYSDCLERLNKANSEER